MGVNSVSITPRLVLRESGENRSLSHSVKLIFLGLTADQQPSLLLFKIAAASFRCSRSAQSRSNAPRAAPRVREGAAVPAPIALAPRSLHADPGGASCGGGSRRGRWGLRAARRAP